MHTTIPFISESRIFSIILFLKWVRKKTKKSKAVATAAAAAVTKAALAKVLACNPISRQIQLAAPRGV